MKDKLQHILQKYLHGKLDLSEQIELAKQLSDEKNDNAKKILYADWQDQLDSKEVSYKNLRPILDKVHHRIRLDEDNVPYLNIWLRNFQRIAAILILPLIISFLIYYSQTKSSENSIAYTEIECPMGARVKFQLPDGSTGSLNSGSKLKYPAQFIGDRKVELVGEAFFDVVHNEKVPFYVSTKNLNIKVLGTTFNVVANEDESTEEVVLSTGKVNAYLKSGKNVAVLKPNEQLVLNIDKKSINVNKVEASQYTSWKDGKLVFRNENIQQVARRLSRWYNAEIVVDDHQLDDYTFHATFKDEPLDEVLKLLCITTPISYNEENRKNDKEGVFQKRKIVLSINPSKIKEFK